MSTVTRFFLFFILSTSVLVAAPKWYEGGDLTRATPEQWKAASQANKVASCADMLAALWLDKKLRTDIQKGVKSMDDLKPYCVRLARELDEGLRDSEGHPKVSEAAAAVIILLKWNA